ncbi:Uncharacterised protein [Prevotella disiens]|uniref:Uncharacterized protein n=1 Tax=Prevotella disiens TaxID=28130 RepID=A0A379DYG1_9BACT|nr:Uncharacterised protein [Prevotella disiens]
MREHRGLCDRKTLHNLNLNEIRRLQAKMLQHISNAKKSGLTLNDYFKEGLHLISAICK